MLCDRLGESLSKQMGERLRSGKLGWIDDE